MVLDGIPVTHIKEISGHSAWEAFYRYTRWAIKKQAADIHADYVPGAVAS